MEPLEIRIQDDTARPPLIYLPGLHGDWTLVSPFRAALDGRVRFIEFTYPRATAWSLPDYAEAIRAALRSRGVGQGWVLGESFGSQIAWELVRPESGRARPAKPGPDAAPEFRPTGLILAGGFVRHPWPRAVRWLRERVRTSPPLVTRALLRGYEAFAALRYRGAPENRPDMREFLARRTRADLQAMIARLDLIAAADPRPIASRVELPVHDLAGLVDPLVPWGQVRRWLRRHCPGYRGGRTLWLADHNVLATAPRASATQVLEWMGVSCLQPPGAR